MINEKIKDGSEFVIFDMEWNQPFPGRDYRFDVSTLTGEIIEIGAVKYIYEAGSFREAGIFSCDIKPQRYTRIHYHVKKVTHKTDEDLMNGISFKKAYTRFMEFCGPDAMLVGWGNSDPDMLKMNLKFFDMDYMLNRNFLDVQPVFSYFAGERGKQRSVEFAVDYYAIPKEDMFHSATADARYTAEIFKRVLECNQTSEVLRVIENSAINPDIKREYVNVGSEAANMLDCLSFVDGFTKTCPVCGGAFSPEIDEFRIRKSIYALYSCKIHGDFFARTKIKKNKGGKYYAASIVRFATQNDYFLVSSKKEEFVKFGCEGAPIVNTNEKNDTIEGNIAE